MKLTRNLFLLLVIAATLFSFKRVIYKKHKTYIYEAFYIKANGDTLTKETIELKPLGRPWIFQFSQTAYKATYNAQSDSLRDWVHPVNGNQKSREYSRNNAIKKGEEWSYLWRVNSRSGAAENKTEVWTHPFRSNQYAYTEIAPFPEVDKAKLYKDSVWQTVFLLGWDNWEGRINCEYKVLGKKNYQYKNVILNDCWEINASGTHSNTEYGVNWNHFLITPKMVSLN